MNFIFRGGYLCAKYIRSLPNVSYYGWEGLFLIFCSLGEVEVLWNVAFGIFIYPSNG